MILVVCAMESEASEIKKEIENIQIHELTPNKYYYKGTIKGKDVILVVSGVGKTHAALIAVVLSQFEVSYIINLGLAGATKPYSIGDKVVIKDASYGDFDVTAGNWGYEFGQVPGMPNPFLSDFALLKKAVFALGAFEESLYTQDRFTTKKDIRHKGIYDMEGASLYQIAHIFNTKIIAIKLISDILDSDTQLSDYDAFEKASSLTLKEMLLAIL